MGGDADIAGVARPGGREVMTRCPVKDCEVRAFQHGRAIAERGHNDFERDAVDGTVDEVGRNLSGTLAAAAQGICARGCARCGRGQRLCER